MTRNGVSSDLARRGISSKGEQVRDLILIRLDIPKISCSSDIGRDYPNVSLIVEKCYDICIMDILVSYEVEYNMYFICR